MKYFFILLLIAALITGCDTITEKQSGEELAKIHCASCHQYPAPDLLDKKSWNKHILPRMGYMLGILPKDSIGGGFIEPFAEEIAFNNPLLFRKRPALTINQWKAIRKFYISESPEKLPPLNREKINKTCDQFDVDFPDYFISPPSTTLVNIQEENIFIGDAHTRKFLQFDNEQNLTKMANAGEVPVWMNDTEGGLIITSMGAFSPTDASLGKVIYLPKFKNQPPIVLIDSLRRPVHTELADLNNDGRFDLIISEFSKWTGCLAWWQNDGKGNFKKHVLRNMPGAIKAYAEDLNGDNLKDIIALFGQGDESIFIYYNQGDGQFKEERAMRFPPSYGSSYFNLFDHNNDGHQDIIYTNGDNADFPPINKPYHGIRIFENNGKNNFKEIFFYPMYGAYHAIPRDFDEDGDLDIAAISFFPDFKDNPHESFIYLENKNNYEMEASTIRGFNKGRWIVMDSGDIDGDKDTDLVLGSLAFEVIPKIGLVEKWVKDGIPFIILKNKLNKQVVKKNDTFPLPEKEF
ncbi:MAG: VCBS repeat-containing protein [Bacteroidota bacterium]